MNEFEGWVPQLRKGFAELLVLLVLAREEHYGYRIVAELKKLGDLVSGEATVYPVLKRLEANGSLASHWVVEEVGPPRKYYAITDQGRVFLTRALAEWDKTAGAVNTLREACDE
ncbi:MAG TPA: PadR family transcriptional regulator [Coriobacteriia bacterium]|nr:PadR family transcriptional regulator [Coriobacteriia bacterium]